MKRVWGNVPLSSRNFNHQMIHFQFIHRFHPTAGKQFLRPGSAQRPSAHFVFVIRCVFLHCGSFWSSVSHILSDVTETSIHNLSGVLLLKDNKSLLRMLLTEGFFSQEGEQPKMFWKSLLRNSSHRSGLFVTFTDKPKALAPYFAKAYGTVRDVYQLYDG